ncbi:MAG: MauE/DoxX family redox-associated membrane protein [bacterium]
MNEEAIRSGTHDEGTNATSPHLRVSGSPHPDLSASQRHHIFALVRRWLIPISRFGLAALFLFTAVAKLTIVRDFAANVSQLLSASGFDYTRWTWPVTIGVITVEVITALLLLYRPTVRIGAVAAGTLLIGFAGYALYYVYALHGEPLECGCFGKIIGSQLGVNTALRNLALLLPVFLVFFGYSKRQRATASDRSL